MVFKIEAFVQPNSQVNMKSQEIVVCAHVCYKTHAPWRNSGFLMNCKEEPIYSRINLKYGGDNIYFRGWNKPGLAAGPWLIQNINLNSFLWYTATRNGVSDLLAIKLNVTVASSSVIIIQETEHWRHTSNKYTNYIQRCEMRLCK